MNNYNDGDETLFLEGESIESAYKEYNNRKGKACITYRYGFRDSQGDYFSLVSWHKHDIRLGKIYRVEYLAKNSPFNDKIIYELKSAVIVG